MDWQKCGLGDIRPVGVRTWHWRSHAFHNFVRIIQVVLDELVKRLIPRLTRHTTNFRANLGSGHRVVVTLLHVVAEAWCRDMRYAAYVWILPHNTIRKVAREIHVCQAIEEKNICANMTCPTTKQEWCQSSNNWLKRWNFPHIIGGIDDKHV